MAAMVTEPMSEAEAYVTEGAREIAERLQVLLRQHRRARRLAALDLARAAAGHPIAAAAAFVAGALLVLLVADRLASR
jgi:hypothetical protein